MPNNTVDPPTATPASQLAGRILYTQFAAGTQRGSLWSVRDDGSDAQQVVAAPEGRWITAVSVAPNGAQIAYIDEIAVIGTGERPSDRQLHLANDGSDDFSPDGTQLAHLDLAGTISLLHLANSTNEALISLGSNEAMVSGFGWDRTGSALLYSINTSGPNRATELRRLDVQTRSEQVLVRVTGDNSLQLVVAQGL